MTDYWNKEILVLGCGNVLFGDDGFGPAAVDYFREHFEVPSNVYVLNAGLRVREILFNLVLSDKRPKKIILLDAVDVGRPPGEILELNIDEIPENKIDDFSMHQLPTSNLLRELKNMCSVDVKIMSVQVQHIPNEVSPGRVRCVLSLCRFEIVLSMTVSSSLTLIVQRASTRDVRTRVDTNARSDISVLIISETAGGKRLFGQYVHRTSPRAQRPFVNVGLSALLPVLGICREHVRLVEVHRERHRVARSRRLPEGNPALAGLHLCPG
jgi:coenzyme F420 hydrogenase subunit delta